MDLPVGWGHTDVIGRPGILHRKGVGPHAGQQRPHGPQVDGPFAPDGRPVCARAQLRIEVQPEGLTARPVRVVHLCLRHAKTRHGDAGERRLVARRRSRVGRPQIIKVGRPVLAHLVAHHRCLQGHGRRPNVQQKQGPEGHVHGQRPGFHGGRRPVALGVGEAKARDTHGRGRQHAQPDRVDVYLSPRRRLQGRHDVALQLLGGKETGQEKGRAENQNEESAEESPTPLQQTTRAARVGTGGFGRGFVGHGDRDRALDGDGREVPELYRHSVKPTIEASDPSAWSPGGFRIPLPPANGRVAWTSSSPTAPPPVGLPHSPPKGASDVACRRRPPPRHGSVRSGCPGMPHGDPSGKRPAPMLVGGSPTRRAPRGAGGSPSGTAPSHFSRTGPTENGFANRLHPGWTLALVSATIGSRRQASSRPPHHEWRSTGKPFVAKKMEGAEPRADPHSPLYGRTKKTGTFFCFDILNLVVFFT